MKCKSRDKVVPILAIRMYWCQSKDNDSCVCPPKFCETVAVRIMKLPHRPRIASTTIKLNSKSILLSILYILLKTIPPTSAGQKHKSADSVRFRVSQYYSPICFRSFPTTELTAWRTRGKVQRFNLLTIKG